MNFVNFFSRIGNVIGRTKQKLDVLWAEMCRNLYMSLYMYMHVKGIWVCALSFLFNSKYLERNKLYFAYLYTYQLSFQYIWVTLILTAKTCDTKCWTKLLVICICNWFLTANMWVIVNFFYKWGNWGSDKLSELSLVIWSYS